MPVPHISSVLKVTKTRKAPSKGCLNSLQPKLRQRHWVEPVPSAVFLATVRPHYDLLTGQRLCRCDFDGVGSTSGSLRVDLAHLLCADVKLPLGHTEVVGH